jgi:membrane protein YdbS with pleckstrin-like domain
MYCKNCGNKLPKGSLFCNRCGEKVKWAEDSPASTTSPSVRPPRPARRRPIVAHKPVARPVDQYQQEDQDDPPYEEEADRNDEEEEIIFQISPTFYPAGLAYFFAISLSIMVTAAAAYIRLPLGIALVLCAIFFIYPIRLHIENKRVVYSLTTIAVEIEEGIFSTNTRNIPLRHIQDVTVKESFKERIIGIGDVLIDSAAATGKITMDNINNPRKYADMILDQLQYWR